MQDWQNKLSEEIQNGRKAQENGKDGLARVCARRAAGWAIRESLKAENVSLNNPSAFEYIKYLSAQTNNSVEVQKALKHLKLRVEKDAHDEDSYWPLPEVDLIDEAKWLIKELLDFTILPTS
ncbi:MAG: hypothetical protein N2D54_12085 [Chloroflexota bacterium]